MHKDKSIGGWRRPRAAGLLTAVAATLALAIPATAAAHPQVYSLTPKKAPTGCTYEAHSDGSCLEAGTVRYAIANDGYSMTFTETAGSNPNRGIINYQLIPGTFRSWTVGSETKNMTAAQILAFAESFPAQSPVQPHATCELAVLDEPTTIAAWQAAEPFYNYIPWQKTTAGLGDSPSKWIPVVQEKTGVDLSALSSEAEFKTACEGKGGTYYKADTGSNPATGAIADAVAAAKAPLETEITGLLGVKTTLQAEVDSWKAKAATLEREKKALEGEQSTLAGEVSSLQQRLASAKKASTKKDKTIKQLRKRLSRGGRG